MLNDSTPYQPFVLNRNPLRYILVYGDDCHDTASKIIWSIVGSPDSKLVKVYNIQELTANCSDALLVFVVIDQNDANTEIAAVLSAYPAFFGDIFGLAYEADTERCLSLTGNGFDSIFNNHMLQQPNIQSLLLKRVEKAKARQVNMIMQQEYRRFRASLAASPDAFIVLDDQNRIFFVSEHYRRAYPNAGKHMVRGLPVHEAFELGRREQGIDDDHPKYPDLLKFWQTLSGHVEFQLKDGRTWRVKASPLEDRQGTIIITSDVSEMMAQKKELEEKSVLLAEALQKEQDASALQKQFIGMVSHEFRTPLAIIDGHAQMMLRPGPQDGEQVKARCKTIRSAVSRLVHMMESVLSSNMLKTGHMDPDPVVFDLGDLISVLCEEQMTLSKPDSISVDVSRLSGTVRLDRKMMTLIITNLLSNAVKFSSENPQIEVTASVTGEDIKIVVADNGIGIAAEDLPKIFDRYYRAPGTAGIPGSGIGLTLVQSLVSLQNGNIVVQSEPDKGTQVTVHLQNLK